jgi:hypothetical protein
MSDFLHAAFGFPTLVLSVLLVLVLVYWVLVLFGVLDAGLFDGGMLGQQGNGRGIPHSMARILFSLRLSGVPVMVALSVLVPWAWLFAFVGSEFLVSLPAGGILGRLAGIVLLVASVALSVAVTARSVRPLRRLLVTRRVGSNETLVGQLGYLSSPRVDERFGEAQVEEGGIGLILAVCCLTPNKLTMGSRVLIVGYDEKRDIYEIAPAEDIPE